MTCFQCNSEGTHQPAVVIINGNEREEYCDSECGSAGIAAYFFVDNLIANDSINANISATDNGPVVIELY